MTVVLDEVGRPGRAARDGGDVDERGRLMSVAQLQRALRMVRTAPQATAPAPAVADSTPPEAVPSAAQEATAEPADRLPPPATKEAPPAVWGGALCPVPAAGSALRPVQAHATAVHRIEPGSAFAVADLLRATPKDRCRRADEVLSATPPGMSTVVVGSLFGGSGCTTLTARLAWAAIRVGVPSIAIDGTGDPGPLDERIGAGRSQVLDTIPIGWQLDGQYSQAPGVFAVSDPRPTLGPAVASPGQGLVVVDVHGGEAAVSWSARPLSMLILLCRDDRAEVQRTGELLRSVHRDRPDFTAAAAVIGIVAAGRAGRALGLARACIADIGAGALVLPKSPALRARAAAVSDATDRPLRLLLACAFMATDGQH